MSKKPETLADLRSSGYRPRTVKEEIRENVVAALRKGTPLFPGIIGYEKTVIPAIVNALLARHDLVLLGLRGQAKTRILRSLTAFLDDEIPVVAGAPLNDDPLHPISPEARRLVAEKGDALPIEWLPRDRRYQEKLATPDVTMADLIGDLDPVKAAARGRSLVDEEAVAYGIIPRANRGIFAINELPDLAPRIQVALLNAMEERDVQIRGFPVRIPLDLLLVFSANPEDYTKRGNLITPLRDRIAAQIHTHYPRTVEHGKLITAQEAWEDRGGPKVHVPELARDLVETVATTARASEWVDQSSGVSARLTIALLETVVSNAERRALRSGLSRTMVRVSDFFRAVPAITGKLELVFEGEREGPERVAAHVIGKAVESIFDAHFPDFFKDTGANPSPYTAISSWFKKGGVLVVSDDESDEAAAKKLLELPGVRGLIGSCMPDLPADEALFGAELLLEGLHQHSALAKEVSVDGTTFRDMVSSMFEEFREEPRRRRRG